MPRCMELNSLRGVVFERFWTCLLFRLQARGMQPRSEQQFDSIGLVLNRG
jgi:hypothetical protein